MNQESAIVAALLADWRPEPGCVLMVHAALRAWSRQGVRGEALCEALLERLRPVEGSLLMPTMTWRTVTPEQPVFDELATPSHTGALTELFRVGYASHRSLHPTHSVAGAGPLAAPLLASHHLGTTPCAANSPYGLMRGRPATILMIGASLACCTALHHIEEVVALDHYVRPISEAEPYTLIDRHGGRHAVLTRRHRRIPRDFPSFQPLLAACGALACGQVLGVDWLRLPLDRLYQLALTRMVP